MTRISRRLFLGGAALLGAGIVLDRVGQAPTSVAEQGDGLDVPTPISALDDATPTLVVATEPVITQEIIAVAAGGYHSLALMRSGEVVAWGNNEVGQTNVPSGLRDVLAVAADAHSLALTRRGEVVAWGWNEYGQTDVPPGLSDVVAVAAGYAHSLAVTRAGDVMAWGWNDDGQTDVPSGLRDVVAVAAGGNHSLALTRSGEVVAWGRNYDGQTDVPSSLRDVVAVSAGDWHSLAVTRSGDVVAWGSNYYGQMNVPSELRDVVAVAARGAHSLALTRSGEVMAWGNNEDGQINVPSELRDVVAVAAGSGHSLALTRSGEVVAWGNNEYGQTNVPDELHASLFVPKKKINIGLVTDVGRVYDGTFNQYAYEGLQRAETELGVVIRYIETQNQTDYGQHIQTLVDQNCELIFAVGFMMGDAVHEASKQHPNTQFAIVDFDYYPKLPNVRGMVFAEDQAGYMAGALAASMSQSGTIAAVGGMEIPPVQKFLMGYAAGARSVKADITVKSVYIDSFVDRALGAEAAKRFISEGADVIFGAGGQMGSGAIQYAAEQGVYVIGLDVDEYVTTFQNGQALGANRILSSAIKKVDQAVYSTTKNYVDNAFVAGTYEYDASNQGIGLAPYHDTDTQIPAYVQSRMNDILRNLANGMIRTGINL